MLNVCQLPTLDQLSPICYIYQLVHQLLEKVLLFHAMFEKQNSRRERKQKIDWIVLVLTVFLG